MFKFFDFFVNLIQTIFTYIIGAVQSVVQVITYAVEGISFLNYSVGALPPFARGGILAIISISVLSLVIGMFIDY